MCDVFTAMCENGTMRRAWVGMNCSACHTNDIQIGDTKLRVEGAPTLADFQGLEEDLLAALKETSRFAQSSTVSPTGARRRLHE